MPGAPPIGLPSPGSTPGFSQLDGPPPSPALENGMNPGMPPLGQMVPQQGTGQLPPEVLSGILEAGQTMVSTLESFAQVTPELASAWGQAKAALMNALSLVAQAGGSASRPDITGPGFPGGGFDRGAMPLASGG